jgi:hypothetical protein
MDRSPVEDLREIDGVESDPGLVSATLVKLIYASREFVAKVYDSNAESGVYVVVLEGVLDVGDRGQDRGQTDEPPATSRRGVSESGTGG